MIPVATWIALFAGLALLLGGGEALVRGAVALATRLGVSKLIIGLTLVGFGTSTPELVASLQAALAGSPGVAVGNVVGSNIANILLILGLSVVILPVATQGDAFRRDGSVLVAATLFLLVAALWGGVGRIAGATFLGCLLAYTVATYLSERRQPASPTWTDAAATPDGGSTGPSLSAALALAVGGIAGVVIGAGLLVDAAIVIARGAGLSETVIGLTLVAVGTSLPELVTGVMAALRRQGDVVFGNIVGSNIFNILGIVGVTSLVTPLKVPAQIRGVDIWVMVAATLLLVVFAVTGRRLSRREGIVFLLAYVAYITMLLA